MATRLPADLGADDVADAVRINHHQLTVLAAGVADLVRLAGGWLYDQARAGWDVTVWMPGHCDPRPLTILGVRMLTGDRDTILREALGNGALAVTAELLRADPDVRVAMMEAVKRGESAVTVVGPWPSELGAPIEPAGHQLSVAARAFKARALSAVDDADRVDSAEASFELTADALRPLYSV